MKLKAHVTNLRKLEEGTVVDSEVFYVKSLKKLIANNTSNSEYYDAILVNMYGSIPVKIWDITDGIKEKDYIELYATCVRHPKYGLQWKVNKYFLVKNYQPDEEFQKLNFTPDVESLWTEMTSYPYRNYTIEKLLEVFVSEKEVVDAYKLVPGSISNHHSYDGGLIQHSYEVWSMTSCLLDSIKTYKCYPKVQTDVALFGAMVHDISKIEEYNWCNVENKWIRNNLSVLVGNPSGGLIVLGRWLEKLNKEKLDAEVIDLLQHIFISHQMRPEWGSPVEPRCIEALAVATADGMSANVSHIAMAVEQDKTPQDNFTSPYYFYMDGKSVWKTPDFDPNYGRSSTRKKSKKPSNVPAGATEIEIVEESPTVTTSNKKGMMI